MNLETKITIYKFTPQVFTLTRLISLIIRQFKKNSTVQNVSISKAFYSCMILKNIFVICQTQYLFLHLNFN